MKPTPYGGPRLARPALPVVLALVLLGACACGGDDATSPDVEVSPGADVTGAQEPSCGLIITDHAVAALGWKGGAPSEADAGRCVRPVEGYGVITVGTRALVGSTDDRSEVAREVYEDECAGMRDDGTLVEEPAAWLGAGDTSCARLPDPGRGTGMAEVFVLTPDEVVQIRVGVLTRTGQDSLHAGISTLAKDAVAGF